MDKQADFPFVRVTMLGASASGKTSIINSFLNKSIFSHHARTDFPQLYYKCVRLPPDGDEKGDRQSVMVEIEDSWGSERNDQGRDIALFMGMGRRDLALPEGVDNFTPFNIWKPPKIKKGKLPGLTLGRMGFMVCFDSRNMASWEEAVRVHVALLAMMERGRALKPVVFMVANKIDEVPETAEEASVIPMAELYVAKAFMRLWKVSASEGRKIIDMYRDMLHLIIGNTMLWAIDYIETEEPEKEQECTII